MDKREEKANKDTLKKHVREALARVIDPELNIPITDMGLVYGIDIRDDTTAVITITLTTIGCPLYETIHEDITRAVKAIPGIKDVEIDLTFDPPWHPEMMSDSAKAELGLI